mmetsp:Transcript_6238/g.24326  ORF Transcript_6238/g.24326 Transcript_6238/m.24326 type:complete len:202 (+) Transcript_6238:573-1178(+)
MLPRRVRPGLLGRMPGPLVARMRSLLPALPARAPGPRPLVVALHAVHDVERQREIVAGPGQHVGAGHDGEALHPPLGHRVSPARSVLRHPRRRQALHELLQLCLVIDAHKASGMLLGAAGHGLQVRLGLPVRSVVQHQSAKRERLTLRVMEGDLQMLAEAPAVAKVVGDSIGALRSRIDDAGDGVSVVQIAQQKQRLTPFR